VSASWASILTGAYGSTSFTSDANNSKNVIYNVGCVCISVRPEVGYFDVKFADSVQGWRRKWLYVKDGSSDAQEYELDPFDASDNM
jgi:hypothetical protein